MSLPARSLIACLSLGLLGCGGDPPGDDGGSSTDDGDSETLGDGDGDPGDGDGEPGDGDGEPGDGDGEPGDGDGDGDPEPLECAPPNPVTARFTVTPSVPRAGTCTVESESSDGVDAYEMVLDCAGESVTVTLDSTIVHMPNPYEMVAIDYRTEAVGQTEDRWLAIHQVVDQQALVLGGVAASRLDPPGTTLAQFFGDPQLTIAAEQPCESTTDSCGELRRLALGVSIEMFGEGDPVFDHGSWYANYLAFGYSIEVEEAIQRLPPINCDDVPDEWYQLLAVWFPSD